MKKTVLLLLLLLSIVSCKKEEETKEYPKTATASFEIVLDGDNFHTASSVEMQMVYDSQNKLKNIIVNDSDNNINTGLSISGFPRTQGQSLNINTNTVVILKGNNFDNYFEAPWIQELSSGTVTRIADNKVGFEGTFTGRNGNPHTVSGYIQSEGLVGR